MVADNEQVFIDSSGAIVALVSYFRTHPDSLVPAFSAIAATTSAATAVISFVTTRQIAAATRKRDDLHREDEHDRARRRAMTEAHVRMTTGEVAEARHLSGRLAALSPEERLERVRTERDQHIRSFYTLAWTLEYLDNLRTTWLRTPRDSGPSTFLKWNEDELQNGVKLLRETLVATDHAFCEQSSHVWDSVRDIVRKRGRDDGWH